MAYANTSKNKPLVCSVVTELQAVQVGKICQDFGIEAIIKIKPFVEISQLKKAVKVKLKERLYDQCLWVVEKSLSFAVTKILLRLN